MSENYLGLTSEVINHYKEREKHYLSKSVEGVTIKPSGQTVPERHDGGSPVAHGKCKTKRLEREKRRDLQVKTNGAETSDK